MLYLSIQSVSTSTKENFEINGSLSDPKISSELKCLLESYAKMLGSTFEDAVELVTGVSNGLSSYKVCSFCFSVMGGFSGLSSVRYVPVCPKNIQIYC